MLNAVDSLTLTAKQSHFYLFMSTSSVVSLEHNLELEEPNIKQCSFYGWPIITESLYYI